MRNYPLFIAGEWIEREDRCSAEVRNPATGALLGRATRATSEDLDAALESSLRGFRDWSSRTAQNRAAIMRRAADAMRGAADNIAAILTEEEGKPLAEAKGEVLFGADAMEWAAEQGCRTYGRIIPSRIPGVRQMEVQEPVGPVAAFVAWNFPCLNMMRKITGALGAGCSIVIKPSEETPGTAVALVRVLVEAGIPGDVINLVFGEPAEISEHVLASLIPKKVTFTGSTEVGKHLQKLSANTLKRCTMELGGHAPVLVFDDADLVSSVKRLVAMKTRNAGQVCISPSRFYIQRGLYEQFAEAFASQMAKVKVGNGTDPETRMGPLASRRRLDAALRLTDDALAHGAMLMTGGRALSNEGCFFPPTVLRDVPQSAAIMQEEPFCPVVPLAPFDDMDEAVALANSTPFGLASYLFSRDPAVIDAVSSRIDAGMVGVNHTNVSTPETPFGGVNESGYGSEGGPDVLLPFLRVKLVTELPQGHAA